VPGLSTTRKAAFAASASAVPPASVAVAATLIVTRAPYGSAELGLSPVQPYQVGKA